MSNFSDTVAGAFKLASAGTARGGGVPGLPDIPYVGRPELRFVGGSCYIYGLGKPEKLMLVKDITAALLWAHKWNATASPAAKIHYVRDGAARYPVDEI